MRILQVHKDFEPLAGGGGTARHIHGLGRALSSLGVELRVVAPAPERLDAPYEIVAGGPGDLAPHIAWADVVHIHGARSTYAFAGARAAARAGKPFFYTPHAYYGGTSPANALKKAAWDQVAERFLATRGAGLILLTEVWRDWFRARAIVPASVHIIPNCVLRSDLAVSERRADAAPLPGAPAILSVGRLDPVKRLRDVISALAEPVLAAGHLHIVGKGAERAALEAHAAALSVNDRVTFHGFVSDEGVTAMIGGAHVFVLASEQEGLPTVLLEMLLSRLPVVASRIPGNLAITDAAGLSSTHEVGDVPALAAALAAAQAATIGDATVAAIEHAFTWERRAPEILALYRAAAAAAR